MTKHILWRAEDVIRAVRGNGLHEQTWSATGVSIDSRTLKKGDLFLALQGDAYDGHAYVAAAFAAGAVAAIVSQQLTDVPSDAPMIFVDDTFEALNDLGRAGRQRARGKIVGVTGSVGKTSTKEMLRLALTAVGNTFANEGNLNNHIGAPLSLANLPPDADYGVFELGMSHKGELSALSLVVRPDMAVITAIEAAHLEFFTSVADIADAKAEIFDGMTKKGIAILNRSDPFYPRLARAAKKRGVKKVLSFALNGKADASIVDCALTSEGSAVNAMLSGYNIHYSVGAQGMHLVQNSLAALLAASTLSGKVDECAAPLSRYRAPPGRGTKTTITMGEYGSFTLIDDSYNASPASVRAAAEVVSQMIPVSGGRRILVLGDMLELGATSPALHRELASTIERSKVDTVFCCGEMMHYLYHALPDSLQGGYAHDSASMATLIGEEIRAHDIVSVKGSKAMKMGHVIDALHALRRSPPTKLAS